MIGLTAALPLKMIAYGQQKAPAQNGGPGFPLPKTIFTDPLYNLTRAAFTQNLKTKFTLKLGGVKLTDVTLMNVLDLNPPFVKSNPNSIRECFSLLFLGPSDLPLAQNVYSIEHTKLGRFQLLIVPQTTNDRAGMHYEAIINRVYP
jgi:uncharacterized protein DUF6916